VKEVESVHTVDGARTGELVVGGAGAGVGCFVGEDVGNRVGAPHVSHDNLHWSSTRMPSKSLLQYFSVRTVALFGLKVSQVHLLVVNRPFALGVRNLKDVESVHSFEGAFTGALVVVVTGADVGALHVSHDNLHWSSTRMPLKSLLQYFSVRTVALFGLKVSQVHLLVTNRPFAIGVSNLKDVESVHSFEGTFTGELVVVVTGADVGSAQVSHVDLHWSFTRKPLESIGQNLALRAASLLGLPVNQLQLLCC
jgi:hypothetical protein